MKTRFLTAAFAITLLATTSAISLAAHEPFVTYSGDEPAMADEVNRKFYRWIRQNLECPSYVEGNPVIELWLHVGDNGEIELTRVSGHDPALIDYVTHTLTGLTFEDQACGRDFHFRISFKRIS